MITCLVREARDLLITLPMRKLEAESRMKSLLDGSTTRSPSGRHFRTGVFLVAVVLGPFFSVSPTGAQTPTRAQLDSIQAELAILRARLDSLLRSQNAVREQDALQRIRAAAQDAARRGAVDTTAAGAEEFSGRQRSLQALNPEISLTGDLFAAIASRDSDRENFVPREFELSLVSALDPFSRAKVFFALEQPGAELEVFADDAEEEEDLEFTVEEGYIEWVALPGGISLKGGRFFQQFGQLNRWHAHALPFQSRSLPHLAFIGEESLIQSGLSTHVLFPNRSGGTYEATFEITRSENEGLFGPSSKLSLLGHLNGFWQLGENADLDLGLSGIWGTREEESGIERSQALYGAEFSFNWVPGGQALYRGLNIRGGLMVNDPEETGAFAGSTAFGAWTLAEWKLARQWLIGSRYSWVEDPADPDRTAWLFSPAVTYWQSEFVRLRAEYDVLHNPGDTSGLFTLRVTFAMGPHKHETY